MTNGNKIDSSFYLLQLSKFANVRTNVESGSEAASPGEGTVCLYCTSGATANLFFLIKCGSSPPVNLWS